MVPFGASSASGIVAEVSGPGFGKSSCPLVEKILPRNACHQCVLSAELLSLSPVYLGFYQVPSVRLSLLLVICWHFLLPRHGPCLLCSAGLKAFQLECHQEQLLGWRL